MFKRIFWYSLGILTALVGLFFLLGKLADPNYTGSKSETVNAPVEEVWALLGSSEEFSGAEDEIDSDEQKNETFRLWSERLNIGNAVSMQIIDQKPMKFIEVRMDDNGLGMVGTWKYEFEPDGEKTKITVTENSTTEGLFTRSLMTLLGRDSNMALHLKAIKKGVENL